MRNQLIRLQLRLSCIREDKCGVKAYLRFYETLNVDFQATAALENIHLI